MHVVQIEKDSWNSYLTKIRAINEHKATQQNSKIEALKIIAPLENKSFHFKLENNKN